MGEKEIAVQESPSLLEELQGWRQQLIRGILRALVIIGIPAAAAGSYDAYSEGDPEQILVYVGAYVILILITFWSRVSYRVQVGTFIILLYGLSVIELFEDGLSGSGRIFLMACTVSFVLFFGRRATIFALGLSTLTLAAFGWAFFTGRIVIPIEAFATSLDINAWVSGTLVFLLMTSVLVFSQNYLIPILLDALAQSRRLTQELEVHRVTLEERVADRTRDLERRTRYLEATVAVARDAASVLDVGELLTRVASLVSEQFGFYHTGLFLIDPSGEWAELQAASSEGGQRMLAHGHRLRVGAQGIVGYATGQGKPRIALDLGQDAVHFDNPDLPDTRSEMALPLRARGDIIGALDVQSTEPQAFSSEDVAVLQALADQVALAISNARLLQQAQESLEAEQRAYGELSREAWRGLLQAQPDLGFVSDELGVAPAGDLWEPQMATALQTGEVTPTDQDETPSTGLAIPIRVRGQVIGVVDAHKPGVAGQWTAEEASLLETLCDQLGVALESTRLYEDTQRRAAQERLISEITTRMRETLDIDTVLQTAIREIGEALGIEEVEVRMKGGVARAGNGHT